MAYEIICKYEILVNFNLVDAKVDCQISKFNSPPNFPAIRYLKYFVTLSIIYAIIVYLCFDMYKSCIPITSISIINHILPSTIRAVISTLTCMSMASNSTSNSECYLAVRVHVRVLLLP